MTKWNWRSVVVDPNTILDAAKSLPLTTPWFEIDLTVGLTSSAEYLCFARSFLAENTALARDAAVCYAKRAVCREIDAFIMCNHCASFLGCNYPIKIDILREIAIPVLDAVRDLVDQGQVFFRLGTTKIPFSLSEHSRSRAVEMWETRGRFPRTVESGVCFPSVRHFHGCLG